jgi:hypothetical protein
MKQTIFKTSLVNCFVQKFKNKISAFFSVCFLFLYFFLFPSFSLILFVSPYFLSFTSHIVCLCLSLSQSQFCSGLNRQPKNSLDLNRLQEPEKRQSRLPIPEKPGKPRKPKFGNPRVIQQVQYLNIKY